MFNTFLPGSNKQSEARDLSQQLVVGRSAASPVASRASMSCKHSLAAFYTWLLYCSAKW